MFNLQVLHSQSRSKTPLKCWAIVTINGGIQSAHCNCMAGLAEACTHIAALMFAVEAAVRLRESKTPTQELAYWIAPSQGKVEYCEIADIDFSSASLKKKKLDQALCGELVKKQSAIPKQITSPSEEEITTFYSKLSQTGHKPGILALISPHCEQYKPAIVSSKYPKILSELRDEKYTAYEIEQLLSECTKLASNLKIDPVEIRNVEEATKAQSLSKMWNRFREGRITASRMKAACRTNPESPAKSLIQQICYPELTKFSTSATRWGCDHEKNARDIYFQEMKKYHENFSIVESGLWINSDYPYIAASPDGLCYCQCCGYGCIEVKCPYCHRDKEILEASQEGLFLQGTNENELKLKKDHSYYYQIQTQIYCTDRAYCDFVVFTNKECYIERIYRDDELWMEIVQKAEKLFVHAVLPELLVGHVSKPKFVAESPSSNSSVCICRKPPSDRMLTCSNSQCSIKIFHPICQGLTQRLPGIKAKWYCCQCRVLPEFKRVAKPKSSTCTKK